MGTIKKKIFSVDDLSDGEVSRLFFVSRNILTPSERTLKKHDHAVLMTAFFEPSTRTRLSFEMAAHRLGLRVLTFHASSSSMSKGENEAETLKNLLAIKPDILVVRQSRALDITALGDADAAIINGGDGTHEHPTQALLDCFTLLNYFRTDSLSGKKIAIVGDILHSRVAHSNIKLMARLGAEVSLIAPPNLQLPYSLGQHEELSSFEELNHDLDVVMCLRVQKERIDDAIIFHDEGFRRAYGLDMERFLGLGDGCVVLHPGPMNLGIEIDAPVANHPRSLINQQVTNGVVVRAGLLDFCLS